MNIGTGTLFVIDQLGTALAGANDRIAELEQENSWLRDQASQQQEPVTPPDSSS